MPSVSMNNEILKTLEAYKQALAPQPGQGLNPDVLKAWNVATGLQAYNLESLHTMFPVLTPIRNITGRVKGKGKKVEYKAITSPDNSGNSPWVAEGSAAALVTPVTTDVTATYRSFAKGTTVTFESQWAGDGYVDMKSLAVVNLLRQVMIDEENAILFGQNAANSSTEQAPGAVGAAPAPTAADGGGSGSNFATATYYVFQTVFTGMGESLPSTGTSVSMTAGHNLSYTPVFPSGQPVFGFRLYVGTTSTASAAKLAVATDMTAAAPSSGSLNGISWLTNGDAISLKTIPTGAAPPTSDASASSLAFNGLYTQMWGGTGATLTNQAGALTIAGLNNLLKAMWNSAYRADPDFCYCNVQESIKLTGLTLGNGTPYQVLVNQGEVQNATANFRVARFTNQATGSELPIRVHPTLPQGTMLFLSNKLPGWYVPTDIPTVWEMDLPQDYVEIDYPPTSSNPLWQSEVRFYGALKLYVPGLQGALYGVNNS